MDLSWNLRWLSIFIYNPEWGSSKLNVVQSLSETHMDDINHFLIAVYFAISSSNNLENRDFSHTE